MGLEQPGLVMGESKLGYDVFRDDIDGLPMPEQLAYQLNMFDCFDVDYQPSVGDALSLYVGGAHYPFEYVMHSIDCLWEVRDPHLTVRNGQPPKQTLTGCIQYIDKYRSLK
ncbi:MAG: hypothetical protein AAGF06_04750 [Pseudomonadota bacterium]